MEGRTLREEREERKKRYYFINLWKKREQTLTLAQGFLRAQELILLSDGSQMHVAESPSDSHAWRKPVKKVGT